jgi:hypothetical protein
MGRARKIKIGLSLLAVAGVIFLLLRSDCGDDADPQEVKLIERAFAGELEAVSALSALGKQRGIPAEEEYWALKGALLGDLGFQKEYVEFFRMRFSETQRQRIIQIIEEKRAMPGAPCLLEMIKANLDKPPPCAQR